MCVLMKRRPLQMICHSLEVMSCRTEGEELEQDLTDKRYIFQDYIAGERVRGLAWLLTYTVLAIWITGVLNKDSPLAP